ncbi:MAG: HEAT repeat domain-containing protein [Spirochaetales bacterium]|nr:HEAT repeat domain-containing protein [Spirochaetales bacterium]
MNKAELIKAIETLGKMSDDSSLTDSELKQYENIIDQAESCIGADLVIPIINLFGYGEGHGVYWSAIHLLEKLPADVVDPLLIKALSFSNPGSQMWSALMLGRSRNRQAIVELKKLLDSSMALVRRNAVIAIGMIGEENSVKSLSTLIEDESAEVRGEVERVLKQR